MENKLKVKNNRRIQFYFIIKRILDILISLTGIIILLPIFIITGIIIKLESKGPIIFKQLRAGRNSKPFYIYKFRSMEIGAPNLSTNEFKNADKFITKSGKFIRKTSIDELPQLLNILKGEMSLVGPRPVILEEKSLILLRQEYDVDSLSPGITGWAQVNGRDTIGDEDKVKLDYEYYLDKSLRMDIYIIILTIFKVLKKSDIKS